MAQEMAGTEIRDFLLEGTRTGKLATVRKDTRPHVAPIWFDLDGRDVIFTTGKSTVKGNNLRRDPRACISVDDEKPPFSFVIIEGTATISEDPEELLGHPHRRKIHGRRQGGSIRKAQRRPRGTARAGSTDRGRRPKERNRLRKPRPPSSQVPGPYRYAPRAPRALLSYRSWPAAKRV